jgi:alcohol dehydrogenase class IV
MARFTLPRDLYHGKGSLEALKTLTGKKAIVVVGGGSMKLNAALDIPTCIKKYEGGIIAEKEFLDKLPKIAELAIGDACTGSNPRKITPPEMEKLLHACYYDTEVAF